MIQKVFVLLLLAGVPALLVCQSPYYYRAVDYGSDAGFNPLSMIFNGSFDELQSFGRAREIDRLPWRKAAINVWHNCTSPGGVISRYGWEKFLTREVLPLSFNPENAQWFPNYTLHLIGGGMVYRKTAEWYQAHEYPYPKTLGVLSVFAYHYMNEMVENAESGPFWNIDPIPDLLLFDPLGVVLFSFDGVAEFFSNELSLNDWSTQPMVSFPHARVLNTSQNFVMKYPITSSRSISLMYHFGNFGMFGFSFKTDEEHALSIAAGVASKKSYIYEYINGIPTRTITAGPIAGVYYDRNNSLMAAVVATGGFNDYLRANLYPGMFTLWGIKPGLFVAFGEGGAFSCGITVAGAPAGISWNNGRSYQERF